MCNNSKGSDWDWREPGFSPIPLMFRKKDPAGKIVILSDLKRYLSHHRVATLSNIAIHFDIEPDAIRGMLEHWIRKGKVLKHSRNESCKKACCKCDSATVEIYEWIK
jgi:hypothetical protein